MRKLLLVLAVMIAGTVAARADTVAFTTLGTFTTTVPAATVTNAGGVGGIGTNSTAVWGTGANTFSLRFDNDTQQATVPPQNAGVRLGIFHTAITGTGVGPVSGTFSLQIFQTQPSTGTQTFIGTITANFVGGNPPGGVGSVSFTPASVTIGTVTYTLSNGGPTNTITLTVPPAGGGFSEGNSVEALVTVSGVPEPTSMFLLGTGLVGLAGAARRKFFHRS